MASDQTHPQRPLRERTSSEGGSELQCVEQMLTVQQREELRADLAEIARLRRQALDAFVGGAEGQDGSPLDIKLARAELGGRLSREHDVSGADFARRRAPSDGHPRGRRWRAALVVGTGVRRAARMCNTLGYTFGYR